MEAQLGSQMVCEHPVTYSRRNSNWVLENLDFLAPWHSSWWLDWGEAWSNDPHGTDPRSNSFALWRYYCSLGSVIFTAEQDERIVGMSVGLWLNDSYKPYWAKDSSKWSVKPEHGDFELALVYVEPEFRGNGMLKHLAELRINEAKSLRDAQIQCAIGNAASAFRLWVQCLDDPKDKSYSYYTNRGFSRLAAVHVKETRRAILCSFVPANG